MAFAELFGRDPLELWLLAGVAAVMLAALARAAWRRRLLFGRGATNPLLVFPEDTVRRPMTPAPIGGLAWAPAASDDDDEEMPYQAISRPVAPQMRPHAPIRPASTGAAGSHAPHLPGVRPALARPTAAAHAAAPAAPVRTPQRSWSGHAHTPSPHVVDEASETIRLPTAADGTVQLLPGMLVMTEGPEIGREFRFLRVGSQPVPELTMGRVSGPPYRHIHLAAATVSRMHARIRYEGGGWQIANLSDTNPLRLNGRELPTTAQFPLADGDRIQLGEVELCYRDGRP